MCSACAVNIAERASQSEQLPEMQRLLIAHYIQYFRQLESCCPEFKRRQISCYIKRGPILFA